MNKKGSMELSVNSIVILVIAIVMLGLILGFVKQKFGDLDKQLVNNEPEAQTATPSDRLTISRETIAVSGGEETVLKVQVYAIRDIYADDVLDANDAAYINSSVPYIECSDDLEVISEVQAKDVNQGQAAKYTMKLKIPSVAKGKYLCLLKMDFPEQYALDDANAIRLDGTGENVVAEPLITLDKDLVIEVR